MFEQWRQFAFVNAEWFALFSIVGFVIGIMLVPVLVSWIPPDYFSHRKRHVIDRRFPITSLVFLAVKNLIGAVLVFLGLLLLFLPGQGILTLLLGLMIMNYPGKFALERWLVMRPKVLPAINWLRERRDHLPLIDP